MKTTFRLFAAVVTALCLWSAGAAGQERRRGDLTCSIESAPYLPFGYYDPFLPSDLVVTNQFSYLCTEVDRRSARPLSSRLAQPRRRQTVHISISEGLSGNFDRRMRGIGDTLLYNIYLDPECRKIWGDGSRGTDVYTKHDVPIGVAETVPLFGRMPAGQSVKAGPYYDLLVVTIDF